MAKIKLEHIDNLRRGKKSWIKLGSRWIPHHLYKYEEQKYNRALKSKFLEVTNKERENLENLWQKVCIVQWWRILIVFSTVVKDVEEIKKPKLYLGF